MHHHSLEPTMASAQNAKRSWQTSKLYISKNLPDRHRRANKFLMDSFYVLCEQPCCSQDQGSHAPCRRRCRLRQAFIFHFIFNCSSRHDGTSTSYKVANFNFFLFIFFCSHAHPKLFRRNTQGFRNIIAQIFQQWFAMVGELARANDV